MNKETTNRVHKSIRLTHYDYSSPGAYFVTLVTAGRRCLFGEIVDGQMVLNEAGNVVALEWLRTEKVRPSLTMDEFVVMPNHIHGIVIFSEPVDAHSCVPLQPKSTRSPRLPRSLGSFISGFKATTTKRINDMHGHSGTKIWQKNYYEHVIRNDQDLAQIREYIANNPLKWELDKENPKNGS